MTTPHALNENFSADQSFVLYSAAVSPIATTPPPPGGPLATVRLTVVPLPLYAAGLMLPTTLPYLLSTIEMAAILIAQIQMAAHAAGAGDRLAELVAVESAALAVWRLDNPYGATRKDNDG